MDIFTIFVAVFVVSYLYLILFQWEWLKKHSSGLRGQVFNWIESKWGEKAVKGFLCFLCVSALIYFAIANFLEQ